MNGLKTAILLAGLTALLLVLGQTIGGHTGLLIALGFAVVMNFGAYWFSDKIVLKMYHAHEATPEQAPELHRVVKELAKRANMPMPKVYVIEDDTPNAFATGRNPQNAAVAATTGILRILNGEELTGVMAHELTHVTNRDTLIGAISATIAGAIAALANIAQFAMIFGGRQNGEGGGNIFATLLMAILAPIAAALIQMAISRSREYAADAGGAKLCGHPLWLASALLKLEQANKRMPMPAAGAHPTTAHLFTVNPLRGGGFATLFSTHPRTEDRVKRLREMAAGRS